MQQFNIRKGISGKKESTSSYHIHKVVSKFKMISKPNYTIVNRNREIYRLYKIGKGTSYIMNLYGLTHDEVSKIINKYNGFMKQETTQPHNEIMV